MELQDYWTIFRRRWRIAVACLVLALAGAALMTWQATPQYASSARLFISTSQTDTSSAYQGGLFATQRVASYADLVQSQQLATRVASDLGGAVDAQELVNQVEASIVPDTVILEITATDPNPRLARDIAEGYAKGLEELVAELETPAGKTRALIRASIVDHAQIDRNPVSPKPARNLGLAAVLGLLLGLGLAVVRDLLDTSVTSADDLTQITESPLLGHIQADSGSVGVRPAEAQGSPSPWSEAFRVLRTNMQYIEVDHDHRVFVVSSSLPGEGKTTISLNLAITMSMAEMSVALVECDLRRPQVADRLGLDNSIGATSVLIGKVAMRDAMQRDENTGLHVLTSGPTPPNPSELLQSVAMEKLLQELRADFDVVIVDAPPLLPVTDAALLAAQADGALLVVRHGKTRRDHLRHAIDRLDAVGAKTLGIVMNMAPVKRRASDSGYGYGYGYGSEQSEPTRTERVRRGRRALR